MLLSLIVPVYNGEKKISRCLKSLMAVEELDIEFIIVNDGSADSTETICEEFAGKDSRFHLINQKNSGVSTARNTGIESASGKFIGFVDADDEIIKDYDEIIKVIKKIDSDFYMFEHLVQTQKETSKKVRALMMPGENERRTLYNNFLSGASCCVWNNIYQLSIIRKYDVRFPVEMGMGEDCAFNANYLKHCQKAYYIPIVGYKYYKDNNESASNMGKLTYLNDFVKIYECYLKIYELEENLEFSFYSAYYIDRVYEILKANRTKMSKIEKETFRNTEFYHKIMGGKYKYWMRKIRKWLIRVYVYVG